jgi:hypothetical protein
LSSRVTDVGTRDAFLGIRKQWSSGKNGETTMIRLASDFSDVRGEARERLRRSPYLPVRSLSCEFDRGVLRLRGSLSSFYHKQLAQETVAGLSGVDQVVNEVVVVSI